MQVTHKAMRQHVIFLATLGFLSCTVEKSMLEERAELQAQKSAVVDFANSGTCLDDASCRLTGLGSKPCGGPLSWLAYSASMDTTRLATLVQAYNAAEKDFNKKWGMFSDCSIAVLPDSLKCMDGKCVKFRDGQSVPN